MPCCPLLERLNNTLIKIPHHKICHISTLPMP
jgi:hypothetical protein